MRKIIYILVLSAFVTGCTTVAGIVATNLASRVAGSLAIDALYSEDVNFSEIKFNKKESDNTLKGIVEVTGKLVYKPATIGGSIRFRDLSRSALVVSLLDNNDDFIGYGAGMIAVKNGDVTSIEKDKLYDFVVKAEIPKNQWDVLVNIKLEKLDIK